jgi:uncharacterized membrane protein YgdD (TMEM256/DUF423 family)
MSMLRSAVLLSNKPQQYFKSMKQSIAIFGVLAVALGAFGAHGLKPHLSELQLETFKTASFYHFTHLVAMLALFIWYLQTNDKIVKQSFYLMMTGLTLFSGSLYILCTRHLIGGDVWTFLGPVTPIGGIFLIAGWANLLRSSNNNFQQTID